MTKTVAAAMATVTVDLIDVITVTVDPTVATTTGVVVTIAVTITVMTAVTIDVATTAATITARTTVTTGVMSAATTGVTIAYDKTTTTAMTTAARNLLHHHSQKGATPLVRFRLPTDRSTSSLVVVRQPRAADNSDQIKGDRASQYRNSTTFALVGVPHHFLHERPLGAYT
jgi:hypothetical protein